MVSHSTVADYYKELGVHRHATSADIRAAYKRLALVWHPDRNKAKEAEEKFKKIKQAYDVLIDDKQRREYDQQQNPWFDGTSSFQYAAHPASADQFNLHTFDQFTAAPVDPFEIINDIQYFQDADFTTKMMNSPSYRNLYTQIFNTMNNDPQNHRRGHTSSPIYLNNDRLFRPISKGRSKQHHSKRTSSKRFSTNIPVIHSTMPNDWFLNELIDTYEQQNFDFMQPTFQNNPFYDDLSHCSVCQKKIIGDRTQLLHHERQCRENSQCYATVPPTTSVRV
ncbi:unnamed protein product [Adineta ricciae]|uniref:J domain-containing protein n=1 Tax=Adineta ricciae TaxID=249248 RepID=A0A815WBU7_ADIRI|nr:unnamed protein product [Adineta ricciae]CAF1546612.1 unnamed protein product [Adineta ricciae]